MREDLLEDHLTMTTELEAQYFNWLKLQVNSNADGLYDDMLTQLYNKEFVWVVPNDDNRIQDALDLRMEFLGDAAHSFRKGASVLEVVVSLARRLAFTAEGDPHRWAWQLITNLGLHRFTNPCSPQMKLEIEEILEDLIWRTYRQDGRGGFFPLNDPRENQTEVEIWYQMNAYVEELPNL